MLPIGSCVDLMSTHRVHINNMDRCCHFVHQDQRTNSTKGFLQLGLKQDQIVTADWCKLAPVGELVLCLCVLFISRDQLARATGLGYEVLLDEVDKSIRMCIALILEVEAVVLLLDANRFVMGVVSQNELLKVKHGPFVRNSLSYLDL
jgi:hypothetical protein